jgi:predicted MPP superfamily phosphohydrolase
LTVFSRGSLLAGGAIGALAAIGISARWLYAARYINPYSPQLERVDLPLPAQHASLAGLRIGFVTDTHVGPFISLDDLQRALELVRAEKPDLLLLGGDYVSESPRYLAGAAERFGKLAAEMPLGCFAVMGNHDYSITGAYAIEALADVGIPILRNDVAEVKVGNDALWIAGIDETLLGSPDPVGTMAKVPKGGAALALWHEPTFAEQAADAGAFAQLSGHTHGGQVRLPVIGPIGLPIHGHRHVIGLSSANGMPVYTSRGVGVYRPPVRINCPPEVTIVTLVAPQSAA